MDDDLQPAPSGIRTTGDGLGSVVELWGEVDTTLRADASRAMVEVVGRGGPVVVDASRVSFIDSAGVAFILQLHRLGEEGGQRVVLRDPAPLVVDLLEMIGMGDRIALEGADAPDTPAELDVVPDAAPVAEAAGVVDPGLAATPA